MQHINKTSYPFLVLSAAVASISCCFCQLQAGVYDFGQGRYGEKRGSWTPGEWLAGILLLMTIVLGLAISVGLCYYVNKRQRESQRAKRVVNYRRQQNLGELSIRPQDLKKKTSSGQLPISTQIKTDYSYAINNDNDNQRRQQQQQQQQRQQQRTPNDSMIVEI